MRVCVRVCMHTCVSFRVFTSQNVQAIHQYFTSESMIFSFLVFDPSQSSLVGEQYQPSLQLGKGRHLGAILDAAFSLDAFIFSSFNLSDLQHFID